MMPQPHVNARPQKLLETAPEAVRSSPRSAQRKHRSLPAAWDSLAMISEESAKSKVLK
jgi:hypothetical protein